MDFLPVARFRFRWTFRLQVCHLPTSLLDDAHFDDRFFQRRRIGLRKRVMSSGVSRIHQGPCGVT